MKTVNKKKKAAKSQYEYKESVCYVTVKLYPMIFCFDICLRLFPTAKI